MAAGRRTNPALHLHPAPECFHAARATSVGVEHAQLGLFCKGAAQIVGRAVSWLLPRLGELWRIEPSPGGRTRGRQTVGSAPS
jgi:hypothetical protein